MTKRITVLILALALCLALVPAQCFAVSSPKRAVVKEAPVSGEWAYNYDGLGVIEDGNGVHYLIDRNGAIYRSGKAWMEYDGSSDVYMVAEEGYYGYPNGETLFTKGQMEASVKAFLQENYDMGDLVRVETRVMTSFSEGYAANSFTAVYQDTGELRRYDFYALIDKAGLVHYLTPLVSFTSGGGFPIEYTLDDCSEGLVRFTKIYYDREGNWYWYEYGYKDSDGNDVLVFSNDSNRDPYDTSVIVIDRSDITYTADFHNGTAVIENKAGKTSLFDRTGKMLLPFEHDQIYNDCGKYPAVFDSGKGWGYIDTAGLTVIPQEYDFASGSWDNLFVVQKDGKFGVVDTDNKAVVPFEYDTMSNPSEGVVYACKQGKAYIITFEDDTLTSWGTKRVSYIFTDVKPGAWYEERLQTAYEESIVGGYDVKDKAGNVVSREFRPGNNLTHGEIMVIVTKLHSLSEGERYKPVPLTGGHWASQYLEYCKAEGIIDGRFDNKLNDYVTREEMAYYFARVVDDEYYEDLLPVRLTDIEGNPYQAEIERLAKADIVGGYDVKDENGNVLYKVFNPKNNVTRAEAVTFVCNILRKLGPTGGIW